MGGIGSGRRYQGGKDTTEDSLPLDIRKIQRAGLLMPSSSFGWQWTVNDRSVANIRVRVEVERVVLVYRHRRRGDVDWQDVEQAVLMDRTACTYGGTRYWWLCPSCGRRVAILYGPGQHYACRHCWKLAYTCQRETSSDRAARRADRIRRRFGWHVGILNPEGGKPKGMQWRSFDRLKAEHNKFVNASLAGMMRKFGRLGAGLDDLLDDR
jgi:hypothetical protein